MSIKSILAVFIITALSICGLTYYSSSSAKNDSGYINPAYKEYIAAYTAGYVSVESKILIVLQEETTSEIEEGKEVDNNLFDFNPSIEGKLTWIDKKTIEFKPSANLASNQTYKASFHLGNVLSVSDELKEFEFEFSTLKQAMEITVDEFKTDEKNSLQIEGTLTTADYADNLLVEKTTQATQGSNSLQIKWLHENSTTHHFTIHDVVKGKGTVTISYNGEPIGAAEKNTQEITIPNSNEFTLLNVVINNEPDQYVTLQFSDKVDPNQNLEGLISIANPNGAATVSEYDYSENNNEKLPVKESKLTYLIENNSIKVYTNERMVDSRELNISNSVKSAEGKHLKEAIVYNLFFEDLKPSVRLVGKGVILPNSSGLIFPFEAVNLNAVDVRITRIYENNMLQFLQVNSLDGNQELRRVGKLIIKKKIALQNNGNPTRNKWNKYSIDLSSLIKAEPGALYNIRLSFNRNYSTYNCQGDTSSKGEDDVYVDNESNEDERDWDYYNSYDDYYDDYYYYDYSERNNPCSRAFYNNKSVNRNILATNIGLIAKRGNNGQINVFTSDLISTKPLGNVVIEAFDYQQQKLKQVTTNGEGIAILETKQKPFVLIAKRGQERTYLKLDDGNSLSLSSFEVDGDVVQKGTGQDGRVTKADILAYLPNRNKQAASTPAATTSTPAATSTASKSTVGVPDNTVLVQRPAVSVGAGDEIIEMDRMRKIIADNMVMSKHVSPHVTSFVEADVTNMVMWRDKVKKDFEKREGEKITFTPLFIECVAKAIKDFPMINVSVDQTGTKIIKRKNINIGMAAALPTGNLIVPVIKNADEKNLVGITKNVNDLATRARANKLAPDEIQGGTFTLTNVGGFGNVMGTPIIAQPQVAILAVGTIKKKPAVIETPQGDVIAIRHFMFLSLSYDHRVVDGSLGGSFLRRVADYMEQWDMSRIS